MAAYELTIPLARAELLKLRAGDTALFLGAGDIYCAAKRLLNAKL